ncbi:MAG: SDR family oxidoreductase [Sphingobacterium sp.]
MEIKGSRILITGGTSGLGYDMAKTLAEQGAKILICGRNGETVNKTAKELNVLGVVADVAKEEDIEKMFDFVEKEWNGLDVLINNAGIGYVNRLTETTTADFTRIWEINVKGAFMAGKAASKIFIRQQKGNIINISSSAGLRGYANASAYVASKFALTGLTECWRAELRKDNVRVMQINPSEVITDFRNKLGLEAEHVDKKLRASEITHVVVAMLTMNDVGFITDASVWATNP